MLTSDFINHKTGDLADGSFDCEKEDGQAHSSVYTTNINHMLAINNLINENDSPLILSTH